MNYTYDEALDRIHKHMNNQPDAETLQEWLDDGGCEATDGCWVEPDGMCEHGCESWLLAMRMI